MPSLFDIMTEIFNIDKIDLNARKNRVRCSTYKTTMRNSTDRVERINQRNMALVARWYYWTELKRLRTDDVLDNLCGEFFIEAQTVSRAVLDYDAYFRQLVDAKTTSAQLAKKYPFFNWK